ncbi:hypothetical protein JR316_0006984 [Psilocybe cubensis]|uniref:Uncharacterized protein n=1 Tax=Psilocybe cubensis TaxID=181762 RepID=A0ACB8GYS8_PSICU|nr:hypothetical protein JR316_0006984 [Psilocybe cubensis]KAH9480386.1 hypothetical protein JR316_0006984 [Psilocybe cubensis]
MSAIHRRNLSSDSLQDTIIDIILVVLVFVLCFLILAVVGLHILQRRRERQRTHSWTSCEALRIVSSTPSSCFPGGVAYAIYEVESNQTNGKETAKVVKDHASHDMEKAEDSRDSGNRGKVHSVPDLVLRPILCESHHVYCYPNVDSGLSGSGSTLPGFTTTQTPSPICDARNKPCPPEPAVTPP